MENGEDNANKERNTVLIEEVPEIDDEGKRRKKKKIIIAISISLVVLIAIGLTLFFLFKPAPIPIDEKFYYDPNEKITIYTINKEFLKLGIISDFQLYESNEKYKRNLKNTLEKMKSENVDVILMAGDIVNNGYASEFEIYKSILNSVYTDENTKPLIFEIMGNHEYYTTKYRKIG